MAGPDWATADRLIYQLQRCFAAVEGRKAELLAEVELLPSHYALMMNVRAHPGIIGSELARLLGVTPQNVTGLVAKLLARQLLERRPHERHPNLLELRLTDQGTTLLKRADTLVAALEEQAVTSLGTVQTRALKSNLEQLRAAVAEHPTQSQVPAAR
ncbi:MarR family winged helix-turn-helix transcriptional regulator [uncultured Friedmanniella sp.]|uniref:MarR family winged helix-turn-helix transcriptional regulator n=1 Tax=uncultured Friedmanniella sp. TaxID=335381 RepID=UPI0035CC66FD